MRYVITPTSSSSQPRSRRIGRCALCHAPILSDEDHYGDGSALVHGACRTQALGCDDEPRATLTRPTIQSACRNRRAASVAALHSPVATGKP